MRILILDDRPQYEALLAEGLGGEIPVIQLTSPKEALSQIQPTDALVTVYDLPGMTGLEVAACAYDKGWRGSVFLASRRSEAFDARFLQSFLGGILKPPFSQD